MRMEKKAIYICEICNRKHEDKDQALNCEKEDLKTRARENTTVFEIKDEHIKLLKEMNIDWNDAEFGAPCIDPKRPYGNSNGVNDIARVIDLTKNKKTIDYYRKDAEEYDDIKDYFEECDWNQESYDYLLNIHHDMQIVLQIVLNNLSFKKGIYHRKNTYSEWEFKGAKEGNSK